MTHYHHTPISSNRAPATAATINSPLGQLDAVLAGVRSEVVSARSGYPNLDARLDALVLSGGNISTRAIGLQAAGATSLVVESTSGFIAGARIAYSLSTGKIEYNRISTIPDGIHLSLTTATGGQILDDTVISMISESEFQAAQAIPHVGNLTLPDAIEFAAGRTINVLAFGARGDGITDDTLAFRAAVQALDGGPGRIWVPYGNYLLRKQNPGSLYNGMLHHIVGVSSMENVSIEGRGTLVTDDLGAVLVIDNCKNVKVQGLTFVGTREALGFSNSTTAILAYGNEGLEISGCHFTQWSNVCIIDASGEFDQNESTSFGYRGFQHETRVHHNIFTDVYGGVITKPFGSVNCQYTDNIFIRVGEYGVKVDGEFSYEHPTMPPTGRIIITNNIFDDVALFADEPSLVECQGIRVEENVFDLIIANNVFKNLRIPSGGSTLSRVRGVNVTTGQTGRSSGRINIIGNTFHNVADDAISVFAGNYTPDPSPLPEISHSLIFGNLMHNCGGGIRLQSSPDCTIKFFDILGNHIYFDADAPNAPADSNGMYLYQVENVAVRDNTIDGGEGKMSRGIYVNGSSRRMVIEGNQIYNPLTACIRFDNTIAGAEPKQDIIVAGNTGRITINSQAPLFYATVDVGLSGVNRLIVENNRYSNSVTTPSAVININGWQEVDVRGNNLRNCTIAINLNTVTSARVVNNVIHETSRNDDAVALTNCTNVIRRHNITNGKIFDEVYTINDDAAISLTPPADMGLVTVLGQYNLSYSGSVLYAATGSGAVTLAAGVGSNLNAATGALTGTTGTDGKVTVSAHSDGKIYIENRSGANRTFYIRFT